MKHLTVALIIVVTLALAVLIVDSAFPTPAERQARDARARARAQSAQAWAAQADERAGAVSVALWGLVAVTLATVAGVGAAVVRLAVVRSGTLHASKHTALFPAVLHRGQWQVVNEPGAQTIAALPSRPSAPLARALLGTPTGRIAPAPIIDATPVALPALPSRVSVYDAPTPGAPALMVGQSAHGPLSLPLANLGNVLVGGLPGSGKSELLAAMIAGLLRTPHAAQVAIVDPKQVDFGTMPADLAGLWAPVATEHGAAIDLLGEVMAECQRRFAMLRQAGARNLAAYNASHEPIPYLTCFVDELADFAGDKRFQPLALEVGRKGRAAGVSLVLATQRPSTDVVDSSLRSVAGAAIAFRVRNSHDSRCIIGGAGAEFLPADKPGRCIVQRGDMTHCQSYYAGLATGHFDRYLATLPKAGGDTWRATEAATTPVSGDTGMFWDAVSPGEVAPAMPVDPAAPVSEAQRQHVLEVYRQSGGSLRKTQAILFPQSGPGGFWFYWLKAVLQAEQVG